jgi:hypothetical protein
MRFVLVALLAFILSGCARDPVFDSNGPVSIALDCDDALPCQEAADVWNRSLSGTRYQFVLGTSGTKVYTVSNRAQNDYECVGVPPGDWSGCALLTTIDVWEGSYYGTDNPEFVKIAILLHEMGHTLGIPHQKSGLMNPTGKYMDCVDSEAAGIVGGTATCQK